MAVSRYYYQDVPLSKKTDWQNYRDYVDTGDLTNADTIANNATGMVLNAKTFDVLANRLIYLQRIVFTTSWDKDRIPMSNIPPEDLATGEVYLQINEVI